MRQQKIRPLRSMKKDRMKSFGLIWMMMINHRTHKYIHRHRHGQMYTKLLLFYFASLSLLSYRFGFSHFDLRCLTRLRFYRVYCICALSIIILCSISFCQWWYCMLCGCAQWWWHSNGMGVECFKYEAFLLKIQIHAGSKNGKRPEYQTYNEIYDKFSMNLILFCCHLHIFNECRIHWCVVVVIAEFRYFPIWFFPSTEWNVKMISPFTKRIRNGNECVTQWLLLFCCFARSWWECVVCLCVYSVSLHVHQPFKSIRFNVNCEQWNETK